MSGAQLSSSLCPFKRWSAAGRLALLARGQFRAVEVATRPLGTNLTDPTDLTVAGRRTTLSCGWCNMKQSLTIRLPDKLRAELERISTAESKPVSDLVRESIQRYITLYTFRRLRKTSMPFAEAQGLLTDEDVFRSIS